jgi:hypothetical protein
MDDILQLFLMGCALVFCGIVIHLIIKHKISERSSVIWLGGSFIILLFAGEYHILDKVAKWLNIDYPPSLLFLLSSLILLLSNLYQSIQITKLDSKVKDLSQYLALKEEIEDTQCMNPNCEVGEMNGK